MWSRDGLLLLAGADGRALAFGAALIFRLPALRLLFVVAEEEALHLLPQNLARVGVGEVQAIVVDEQARVLLPHLPGLLRDVVVDALAKLTGHWWFRQSG